MSSQLTHSEDLLIGIQKNMPVFDVNSQRVGTVKYIQFADDTADETLVVDDPRVQKAPTPLRMRLLKSGFIRVDTGLLSKDCYASSDQISGVFDQGVQLKVLRNELLTL